jgi:hypothetical protein
MIAPACLPGTDYRGVVRQFAIDPPVGCPAPIVGIRAPFFVNRPACRGFERQLKSTRPPNEEPSPSLRGHYRSGLLYRYSVPWRRSPVRVHPPLSAIAGVGGGQESPPAPRVRLVFPFPTPHTPRSDRCNQPHRYRVSQVRPSVADETMAHAQMYPVTGVSSSDWMLGRAASPGDLVRIHEPIILHRRCRCGRISPFFPGFGIFSTRFVREGPCQSVILWRLSSPGFPRARG